MLIQTVTVIWWLAKLDLMVQIHDKFIEHGFMEKALVLEERVKIYQKNSMSLRLTVQSANNRFLAG